MAIYWIDPYLQSSNGGLPSSSSGELGTYSQPYKIDWFSRNYTSSSAGILDVGDEIRFKGLSESVFFPTNRKTSWSSTNSSTYYINFSHGQSSPWTDGSGNQPLVKIKDIRGNYLYAKLNQNKNYIQNLRQNSFWEECFPNLDTNYGTSFFNNNY